MSLTSIRSAAGIALLAVIAAGRFHEDIHASFVVESIVIEAIVTVALGAWTVLAALPAAAARPASRTVAPTPARQAPRRM
jgi:hypothetical protein